MGRGALSGALSVASCLGCWSPRSPRRYPSMVPSISPGTYPSTVPRIWPGMSPSIVPSKASSMSPTIQPSKSLGFLLGC